MFQQIFITASLQLCEINTLVSYNLYLIDLCLDMYLLVRTETDNSSEVMAVQFHESSCFSVADPLWCISINEI